MTLALESPEELTDSALCRPFRTAEGTADHTIGLTFSDRLPQPPEDAAHWGGDLPVVHGGRTPHAAALQRSGDGSAVHLCRYPGQPHGGDLRPALPGVAIHPRPPCGSAMPGRRSSTATAPWCGPIRGPSAACSMRGPPASAGTSRLRCRRRSCWSREAKIGLLRCDRRRPLPGC